MVTRTQTAESLMKDRLKNKMLVVLSTTEPYVHNYVKDEIKVTRSAGGVITALEPIIKLNKGLWISHARGTADKEMVDANDRVKMPPGAPNYTLRRLWLTKKNLRGWYYGFANQALWPLCHNVFERPLFNQSDWDSYIDVNKQFADAALQEVEDKQAVIWIQDYQLALVSKMIKEKRPDLVVGTFWHIPWPGADTFKICPWDKQILEGMLGNQLIGFQRHSYCRNFLTSVSKTLEAKVDFDNLTVTYNNHVTYVRHFPISIDYKAVSKSTERNKKYGKSFIKQYLTGKYEYLSLGVERLDYTKGLPERIKAIDRFLEKYPEYHEKFVHVNILVPSRTLIKRYEDLDREMETLIENVNFKYATANWQPIHIIKHTLPPSQVYSFYKSANLTMVTSLADGMNLVAKEYVTAGPDDGALILSEQAGAADELHDALIVNPYDIEGLSENIKIALEMPKEERKLRIQKMREAVRNNNVYKWAGKFIEDLVEIDSHHELKSEGSSA
jgi:alpha,alpha-trehalose-phosphate synthase [UDP-forming]